ncbi:MAG TPA: hypothetical protein VN840_09720 [Streptosporangiaceae bacterium]|nr:hypothetical protein [Streptosporangiaceae bacterium]
MGEHGRVPLPSGRNRNATGLRGALAGGAAAVLLALAPTAAASTMTAGRPARAAAGRAVPIVVIVMENETYQTIIGNRRAPFINKTMIRGGLLDTNDFAVPGSEPDYLLMVSGRKRPRPSARNLFAALGRRTSWREYMESMPSTCYLGIAYHVVHGTRAALYGHAHNPAIYFTSVTRTSLCRHVVPLNRTDFRTDALPRFSLVVPNECNDMHTQPTNDRCPMWNGRTNRGRNEITLGDRWLASFVPAVARVATVILTWDEGNIRDEHIVTVSYGVGVTPGRDNSLCHQQSLEAALYRYFRLGRPPGQGADAAPLPIG